MRAARGISWCFVLSLCGIGIAGYLTFIHLGLLRGELLGGAVCSGSGALNCHAVTEGSWGSLLGMPLSLWGLLGYVVVFALSLLGLQSSDWADHALTLIFAIAFLCVGIDAVLFAIMAFVIRLYCLFCLLTYAVNLSLLVIAGWALGRSWAQTMGRIGMAVGALAPSRGRPAAALCWGILLIGVLGTVAVHASTRFVTQGSFGSVRRQMREFVTRQPRVTVDVAGDPTHGHAGASLQIVEFSDFLCPACQRASKLNTIILASHRRDAVFIFKHYPLDTACNDKIGRTMHPGACRIAAASECAHLQGTFWPFHDLVFEKGQHYNAANVEADARHLGLDMSRFGACLESGQGLEAVKRDVAEGARIGVTSTPTYFINGLPVPGGIQPSAFEDFVAVLRETGK